MEKFCFCFKNFGTHQNVFDWFQSLQTTQKRPDFDLKGSGTHKNVIISFPSFWTKQKRSTSFFGTHQKTFQFRSDNQLRYRNVFTSVLVSLTLLAGTEHMSQSEHDIHNFLYRSYFRSASHKKSHANKYYNDFILTMRIHGSRVKNVQDLHC